MKNRSGFTLMELMISIAIVAILSVVAVPNIVRWRTNAQLSQGARQIYSDLQGARKEALKNNSMACVSFDAANHNYRVFLDRGGTLGSYDAGTDVPIGAPGANGLRSLPPGVEIVGGSVDFTEYGQTASFTHMGFARSFLNDPNDGELKISLASGGRSVTISVGPTGTIRIL